MSRKDKKLSYLMNYQKSIIYITNFSTKMIILNIKNITKHKSNLVRKVIEMIATNSLVNL
jgi:hypothetical protein